MKFKNFSFRIKIRIFLAIFNLLIFVIFFWLSLTPFGKAHYQYHFDKENFFIRKIIPQERVNVVDQKIEIKGDPVYFFLRTPRSFDRARLNIQYENPYKLPILEAGVILDNKTWSYELKPLNNEILNNIGNSWQILHFEDIIFYQRENKYKTFEEFLSFPPPISEVAVYNYDYNYDFIFPDYTPKLQENKIPFKLRGSYGMYVYIKNEPLNFVFNFSDLNEELGPDNVNINIYFEKQLIEFLNLTDDGEIKDNMKKTQAREMKIFIPDLPEGVYKIEIKTNNDILTESIITKQSLFSFVRDLWVTDVFSPINFYTNSRELRFLAINPSGLQDIVVNQEEIKINETYKQFFLRTTQEINQIKLMKGDVRFSGDGVFSYNNLQLLNPEIKKIRINTDLDKQKINYILAKYIPPIIENNLKNSSIDIDLTRAYRDKDGYKFIISVPGLKTEDEINDALYIRSIKIELEGKNIFSILWNIIK